MPETTTTIPCSPCCVAPVIYCKKCVAMPFAWVLTFPLPPTHPGLCDFPYGPPPAQSCSVMYTNSTYRVLSYVPTQEQYGPRAFGFASQRLRPYCLRPFHASYPGGVEWALDCNSPQDPAVGSWSLTLKLWDYAVFGVSNIPRWDFAPLMRYDLTTADLECFGPNTLNLTYIAFNPGVSGNPSTCPRYPVATIGELN